MRREQLEQRERDTLACWAMLSADSRGRVHPEDEPTYRTRYQRDRDRIIHCKAFRRLEYKTQVFLNHESDHYRTRLTHTIEVTQIARTLARSLGLNEDLTEAVALAHDLGHTPFGHCGETALDELMKERGEAGFEHNAHGLRVVDLLERQYPDFPGLNLTHEVRESIIKHNTTWDAPHADGLRKGPPPLEGQIVEVADTIAYDNHDLLDGVEAGILEPESLAEIVLWRRARQSVVRHYGDDLSRQQMFKQTVRHLINLFVTDVITHTQQRLEERSIGHWREVLKQPDHVVGFSAELQEQKAELEEFLFQTLYRDYRVVRATSAAQRFVRGIFNAYVDEPRQLPPDFGRWADEVGPVRAVCDYVAGMTDRYAQDLYLQLFHPYQKL
jgi:dGTPase